MPRAKTATVFVWLLVLPLTTYAKPQADVKPLLLDDFETAPKDWKYIDGREFPGAKGSLTLDAADAHGGKRSYKLEADFSGGGAYVGVWRDLASLKGRDVNELRRIMVGLYDHRAADRGWDHQVLKTGEGVKAAESRGGEPATEYQIGVLKVDSKAPLPQLPKATLNLDGYKMTFDDGFDDLSVSASGPGTRWFTATKENFGDARFVEQKDGFPFTVEKGILRIEAAKKAGGWPIDKAVSPSYMYVDYVRAYAKRP
jgi:hypothetical protein